MEEETETAEQGHEFEVAEIQGYIRIEGQPQLFGQMQRV
jgi:hypothetical protein